MTLRDDAIFLAGCIVEAYGARQLQLPVYLEPVIHRIMGSPFAETASGDHVAEVRKMIEPAPPAPPQLQPSDEEKIAAHIEQNGIIKPKRKNNISPEQREAAAQRMRDYQARIKSEKEAAARVTITVEGRPIEDAQIEDWRSRPEPEIHKRPDGAGKLGEYFNGRGDDEGNA